MILPLRARKLIREYSKPLTRPNWKTQPSMSLYKFYTNTFTGAFLVSFQPF